jgi:hypothetical protein
MPRTSIPFVVFSSLAVVALACGGGAKLGAPSMHGMAGRGPVGMSGAGGMMMPPGPMNAAGTMGSAMKMPSMKPGMMGAAGVIVIGIPTPGSPGTVFPGGGPAGSAPLAPGCTPASAHECPTSSGACATSATSKPTGTTTGSICFYGPSTTTTTTSSAPAATIEYLHETAGGQEYYRFRITFDPAFVDNTYGANAIGWGQRGHTFMDLVGSDHAELSVFDGTSTMVSMFDIDYITANAASSCGYGALGVGGGEGKMLAGDAKYVLASTTSLDRNLNGCGYCMNAACGGNCTSESPSTDAKYTPNTGAPNWDFRVVYEVWMDAAVFAGKGFGGASITFVHASPSKASSNTITVTPKPCGGCPEGQQSYETSRGSTCCPSGSAPVETEFGPACQSGGGTCAQGERGYKTSEGWMCCAAGTTPVDTVEGPVCQPVVVVPCPEGSVADPSSEGAGCIPVVAAE